MASPLADYIRGTVLVIVSREELKADGFPRAVARLSFIFFFCSDCAFDFHSLTKHTKKFPPIKRPALQ
jgi:hypothetical protein